MKAKMKTKKCDMCGRSIDSYFAKHNLKERKLQLFMDDENGREKAVRKVCRKCFLEFAKSKKSWPTRDYLREYLSDENDPHLLKGKRGSGRRS